MKNSLGLMIILIVVIIAGGPFEALAANEQDKKTGVADLERELEDMFDFSQWAEKSGTRGIFHAKVNVKELFGPKYKLNGLVLGKSNKQGRQGLLEYSFRCSINLSNGDRADYSCVILENVSIRAAHRELCMQWLKGPSSDQPQSVADIQIGNYHFVTNPKEPTSVVFSRGNVVVALGSLDDQPKSVIPVAKEIDRRLQMKHLTQGASLQDDTFYKEGGLQSAQDIDPGEKTVVARNVRKEKKSLSVVSSSGSLYLNDKDQLILDTTGTEESKIRVWEVERKTYRTGKEEQEKKKPESDGAQEGGFPTLDSGPWKNKRETHPQDKDKEKEKEKEKKDSPPPVTDTLGDTE